MKAVVFTLGCKVNECESDSLISGLVDLGYEVSDKLVPADLYIVNTCAVTNEAEKKSRQMASRIKAISPNAKIIFTGCAVQKNAEQFMDKSNDFLLTGVFNKNEILSKLSEKGKHVSPPCEKFEELLPVKSLRTRDYVKVQDGCNNFCSYCIIPYLRGRNRARAPENVYQEIKNTKAKEVVINGINLSAYDYNGINLTGLIKSLKDLPVRIRLGSLEVGVIDREFLGALKELYDFEPHFHLSLQSGCDSVLKKMNRHYTTAEYLEKVNLIREYFADAGITTDIIVGFPTEREQDFNETMEFVQKVGFSDIHPFPFSSRSGTVASKMKDLSKEVKKQRLDKLVKIKEECKRDFALRMVGKELDFLFEEVKDGYAVGYTQNYLRIYIKDYKINENNQIEKVLVLEPYLDGAIAKQKGV